MSRPVPAQLSAHSQPVLADQTSPTEVSPPSAPSSASDEFDPNAEEWREFDWAAYRNRAAKRVDAWGELETRFPDLLEDLSAQLWLARRLTSPTIRWILADLPTKMLWEHLGADALKPLKYEALRGFQQAPGSLRREPVQKRLAAWLLKTPDEIHLLLLSWALQASSPPSVEAARASSDESALEASLPALLRAFGAHAVSAALAFQGAPRAFAQLTQWLADEAQLKQIMETAPLPDVAEVSAIGATAVAATAPASELADAESLQRENEKLHEVLAQLRAQFEKAQRDLAAQAGASAKIKRLQADIDQATKTETKKAAQFAKQLAQNEAKWAVKYEELGKTEAREERRARSLQAQIEKLEADNKSAKRQVRQSAQLREDERRKVVALEAQLAELRGDKKPAAKKPMDAVSSPPTTRDAPNKKVVVSKPSPLDEIFEWSAHGRRIRMNAREVQRLIDRNDEERVGTVMLELEALKEADPALRKKFLERLSMAGTHYARVLTRRTTRVLVDASNVARFRSDRHGKGHLADLQLMRQELQRLDCWPIIFIADASLPHHVDRPGELREMARLGEIILTDKGIEADEVLAREARATGAYVVTNDAKFFYKVSPDYEPPRLSFSVQEGLVMVDEF